MKIVIFLAVAFFTYGIHAAEITFHKTDSGISVHVDGQPFTTYVPHSFSRPILWPLYNLDGLEMTRRFPMRTENGKNGGNNTESTDHSHHRSVWFGHGDVNGEDFWTENPGSGKIIHRKYIRSEPPELEVACDWMSANGKRICYDTRVFTFGADKDIRWIDIKITLHASDGTVVFNDTKEGTLGLRVPCTLEVTRKMGGKIINSEGLVNEDAWGKQASWVDYSGPVSAADGTRHTVGITMMNHPESAFYPTYWHVRTYGLFAANPFGVRSFIGNKKMNGSFTLNAGKSITLYYRIIFHRGDEKFGKIAERFKEWSEK